MTDHLDDPEPDDDGWQEYKDNVAMGYINEDGTQREPEPPDDRDTYTPPPGPQPRPKRVRRPFRDLAVRLGPFEITIRRRAAAACGACKGLGWFHTKGTMNPHPAPEGYDGVALCGCGTAHDKLNESRRSLRRYEREWRSGKTAPF